MNTELEQVIQDRLSQIIDPCSVGAGNPMNVVEMGLIKDMELADDGELSVQMCLTSPQCLMLGHFVEEARRVTADVPEVREVVVRGDSGTEWTGNRMSPEAKKRRSAHLARMLPIAELIGAGR